PDAFLGHVEPGGAQPRREVARREDRVVGEHEELGSRLDPVADQFGRALQRLVLVHEHAVHVGEPALDVGAGRLSSGHGPSVSTPARRQPNSRSDALRAPSVSASIFAHAICGCTRPPRPQSVEATTFSGPTTEANASMRSATSSGCSTTLVECPTTPGSSFLPAGSSTS